MKIRFSPLWLGLFFIGGIGIAIIALVGLGSHMLHPSGRFVFYLPNSAGELNEGSGIRLDGVRVGQVNEVRVYYNPETRQSFVGITCEISKNILKDPHGNEVNLADEKTLRDMISKGLVVQIQTAGLVGTEFVELTFNPSEKPVVVSELPASPYPVMPAIPSQRAQLTTDVSGVLANLRQIDYHAIAQQVNDILVALHGQVVEIQTNHLTDQISAAALSARDFMSSPDLRATIAQLRASTATLQTVMTNINAQVVPTTTHLNEALESASQSVEALQDFLKIHNQLGEQTSELMDQLNETARSIEQLSNFLQQHPNAIITGRSRQNDTP